MENLTENEKIKLLENLFLMKKSFINLAEASLIYLDNGGDYSRKSNQINKIKNLIKQIEAE